MNIISRAEAVEQGLTTYFLGKPCIHGHMAERYVSSKGCLVCQEDTNIRRALKCSDIKDQAEAIQERRRNRREKRLARNAAAAAGMQVFWKGHPCRHGHVSGWMVSTNHCRECARKASTDSKRRARAARRGGQS